MTLGFTPSSSSSSSSSPSAITSSEIPASVSSSDTPEAKFYQDLQQVRQGQMTYVTSHAYKSGTFTGTLRDGKPYEGFAKDVDIIYKKFDGVVKEGALAYENRTRMQRPDTVTPFQQILRQGETPFQRLEAGAVYSEGDEQVRRKVLNYDLDYVELSTDEKFDITNDNQRRFFDTVFAKEMLTRVLSDPKSASELRQFSDKTFDLFCTNILSEYLDDWKLACAGKYTGKDQRLQQLSTQTVRAHDAVENLPLSAEQKQLCLDLYERRYLNYLVDETDAYKNDHPKGIIKSKTNPLYFKRGRLDGDFALRDSMHAGILRNIDQCPPDLRFSQVPEKDPDVTPGLYTRCPDRLHMASPDEALDNDPDSWLSRNFLSGTTPYVNGLSGSMLIEIGGLTYIKEHLNKEKLRTGESGKDFLASRDMIPVLDNYFRALAALYVYLDGGHSLFEIQSSFKQTWIAPALTKVFKDPQWGKVGQDLYQDVDTFKAAWQATRQFDNVVRNKQNVHRALREATAGRQSSPDMASLPLRQTEAARHALHRPNPVLMQELSAAAGVLHQIVARLDDAAKTEIGAHLSAPGRLLDGQKPQGLLDALRRVHQSGKTAASPASSATDRAVVLALMGDIGGFFTTPKNASEALMTQLKAEFETLGLQVPTAQQIERMRQVGGSAAVGPTKRAEREIVVPPTPEARPWRAGVHNTGAAADAKLGIAPEDRIRPNQWVEFKIAPTRTEAADEPFVGHMSASPSEILQAWDLLSGETAEHQYVKLMLEAHNAEDDAQPMARLSDDERARRLARAAGTAAFLVGLGYHSAVEVLEGTLAYTGQSLRSGNILQAGQRDAADIFGHGAATDLMCELFETHTVRA